MWLILILALFAIFTFNYLIQKARSRNALRQAKRKELRRQYLDSLIKDENANDQRDATKQ